jgi:hypothetical protein
MLRCFRTASKSLSRDMIIVLRDRIAVSVLLQCYEKAMYIELHDTAA